MRVAVVGAAVRLPGVTGLDELRVDLADGRVHLERIADSEARENGATDTELADPRYVPVATSWEGAHLFDRERFGTTPGEARWTDPQQRWLLTLADEALETSGLDRKALRIGAVTTTSTSTYLGDRAPESAVVAPHDLDLQALLGTDRDFSASRLAFRLGLGGPAFAVHSACSSSLVALHQACSALATEDADAMIVGAVSLAFPQRRGYLAAPGGVLSPTGTSRPFDSSSDGTVRGSGGGAVVLRPLEAALSAGDPVLAVIAGSAVNNDGPVRMGFSSPSAAGQEDVLRRALDRSGIDPDTVGLVEAHGTGTPLGDPVEVRALGRVYADRGGRAVSCALGSAKANYGHLDVAAGMIGLLKVVLALREDTVFVQPSFHEPNPALRLDRTPFAVPTATRRGAGLRRAAVSSFGMGGTNAHVVLEAAPPVGPAPAGARVTVTVSADTAEALDELRHTLSVHLGLRPDLPLDSVAATLALRPVRARALTVSGASLAELADALAPGNGVPAGAAEGATTVAPGVPRVWLPPTPSSGVDCSLPPRADRAAPAPAGVEALRGLHDDPRELLLALVSDELGVEATESTGYFDEGGDSLGLVDVLGRWQDRTGIEVPLQALEGSVTVGDLADACLGVRGPDGRVLEIGSGEPRLVVYPPAGGSTFCYSALAAERAALGFLAVRAVPGARSLTAIAEVCAEALRSDDDPEAGLLLGGYSFGGNVAVELARILESEGRRVRGVVLVDSFAPAAFSLPEGDGDAVGSLAGSVQEWVDAALAGAAGTLDRAAADRLSRDVWVDNVRALREHRPAGPIDAPVILLRADSPLAPEHLTALGLDHERSSDWGPLTTGGLTVVEVPGDHYTVLTDPGNRAAAAEALVRAVAGLTASTLEDQR